MRPRPKLRTFCRWMLTFLTVMLVVVWIGSAWYSCGFGAMTMMMRRNMVDTELSIHNGLIRLSTTAKSLDDFTLQDFSGYALTRIQFDLYLWRFGAFRQPMIDIWFPLWIPSLLVTIPAALLWRSEITTRRLRMLRECYKCGYPRTGLAASTICPECGTAFPVEISKAVG